MLPLPSRYTRWAVCQPTWTHDDAWYPNFPWSRLKKQMIFVINNSSSGDSTIQSAPKKKHSVSHKPFSPQLYTVVLNHRFVSAMWQIDTSPSPNGLWSWSDHRTFFRKVPAACEFHGIWNSYLPPTLKCRKRTKNLWLFVGYNDSIWLDYSPTSKMIGNWKMLGI